VFVTGGSPPPPPPLLLSGGGVDRGLGEGAIGDDGEGTVGGVGVRMGRGTTITGVWVVIWTAVGRLGSSSLIV
jgi:hypothetical protein